MEPRLRASPEQFSALIEFMERHGDLSRPQPGAQGRLRGNQMWLRLTSLLNSIGGGVKKTQDKWKKVWADWKTKTKKKYMYIRRHATSTGGGPSSRQTLTALEERVVAILGVSAVVGQAGIQEQGFHTLSVQSEEPIPQAEQSEVQLVLEVPYANIVVPTPSPPGASTPPPPPLLTQDTQPSHPPQEPPPPPPPRTPPRPTGRQPSASPRSATATPRRRLQLRARRNRGLTPFDRAASEFVAVEQRRLQMEETRERLVHEREIERDRLLHERETERLRLESQKLEASREHNRLLQQLSVIGQRLLETLPLRTPSLPSTDVFPDTE